MSEPCSASEICDNGRCGCLARVSEVIPLRLRPILRGQAVMMPLTGGFVFWRAVPSGVGVPTRAATN
jgi:hypothetical protein